MRRRIIPSGVPSCGMLFAVASLAVSTAAFTVSVTVNTSLNNRPINPTIYGTNQNLSGTENFAAFRQGGNRTEGS
ncbi:MAG: hypothetical protein JXA71_18505 [Chitinispirillaceae bacterium]|nr:hypothetical protein [Chitinispirillaceae bacterium]